MGIERDKNRERALLCMPPKKKPTATAKAPEPEPAVKRRRGRPRKHRPEDKEAAESLAELPRSPILTEPLPSVHHVPWMAAEHGNGSAVVRVVAKPGNEAASIEAGANLLRGMEEFLTASSAVKALVQAEIRKDPRTEELKQVKAQLASMDGVTKEEKELNRRIQQDLTDHKRRYEEVLDKVGKFAKRLDDCAAALMASSDLEQCTKRVSTLEARIKALESRAKATDDRVASVEERCK